jgi:hypothetical protein
VKDGLAFLPPFNFTLAANTTETERLITSSKVNSNVTVLLTFILFTPYLQ